MARSRNIKPGFFNNEDLVELDFATRLLFAGLWTVADRAGRLQDRPKKIKIDVFPADSLDVDAMLQSLHDAKFIIRYEVDGIKYIQVTKWAKHQNPHHTENWSKLPDLNGVVTVKPPIEPKDSQEEHGGNLADSLLLIPDPLIPEKKTRKARTSTTDVSLSEYLGQCKTDGRKAVPESHPVHAYCADAGIGTDMLELAWMVFKDRHLTTAKAKRYLDWPGAFANSVKGCWYHLWHVNAEGRADWSKVGIQERRVVESRMNQAEEVEHAPA